MKRSIDLSRYSSIRIGPRVAIEVINEIDPLFDREYTILGKANNTLISPTPPPLAILGRPFNSIHLEGNRLVVGGATPTGRIVAFCQRHNIGGLEFLAKIPGTIGGAIKMNAGAGGHEIKDRLCQIRTAYGVLPAKELGLAYRRSRIDTIIYQASFTIEAGFDHALYQQIRSIAQRQPKEPSAGSCFKNPPGHYAGALLESVGLRGFRRGGMAFSPKHANFLINLGGGTFDEAVALIQLAKKRVYEHFGVVLEEEIIILDTEGSPPPP
ncbi:MAG: UDP-N-acetylmuramate dehydrogenase [Nitratiruptor sp.]|nr:UDP-N-acetylmuramate dehydrogenase [Nitratiruptor sp.]NPA83814.1 UDP-N-acetylmuramate dehydrogenase [Campylobacterota bacterium]